jgi:acyl-CoA thioester hydrolase
LGKASVQFTQEARRINGGEPQLLATGDIKVGCVDAKTIRPSMIPDEVAKRLMAE